MNYAAVVRILCVLGLLKSSALLLAGAVALAYREWIQLAAISMTLFVLLVLSLSLLLLTPKPVRAASPKDGLAVLVLWWVLAGCFGAGPFIFDAYQGWVTPILHESFSSLTTTGHAALVPVSTGGDWPNSLIVWRGLLHIIGALTSLVSVASIFAALNLGGPGIHKTVLFTLPEGSFFDALPRVLVAASLALAGLIGVVATVLSLSGVPFALAMSDAVSVATTGLVDPGRASDVPINRLHAILLFVGLVFSTIGLAVALEAVAGRWRGVFRDPEVISLVGTLILFSAALGLLGISIWDAVGWNVSLISTSGMPLGEMPSRDIPLIMSVVPALIGGSALSTAGGLKLARLYLLFARAGEEFARLGFRDSVVVMRFRGRVLPDAGVIGVWVYLVAYVVVIAALIAANTLCNLNFPDAVSSAVGLISNTGSLIDLSASNRPRISDLLAIAAMILGRLEIIALIPALSWGFWRA